MICLDTNVVIAYLTGRPRSVIPRVQSALEANSLALSVVTVFELHYGAAKSARRPENLERLAHFLRLPFKVLDFEPDDVVEAGEIRAHLEMSGTPIGPYDVLIAAQARRRAALLVTSNTREFARVPGLRLEDWAVA